MFETFWHNIRILYECFTTPMVMLSLTRQQRDLRLKNVAHDDRECDRDGHGDRLAWDPLRLIVRPPGPSSPARERRRWSSSETTEPATTWRRASTNAATTTSGPRWTRGRGSRRPSALPVACRTVGNRPWRCRSPPEKQTN